MTTPNQIIAGKGGWTPGNTQAAANVAKSAGIGPDDDIGFSDSAKAQAFMRALVTQEQGSAAKAYPDEMIAAAVGGKAPADGSSAAPAVATTPNVTPAQTAADQSWWGKFTQGPIDPATGKPDPNKPSPMAAIADAIIKSPQTEKAKEEAEAPERSAPFATGVGRAQRRADGRDCRDGESSDLRPDAQQLFTAFGLERRPSPSPYVARCRPSADAGGSGARHDLEQLPAPTGARLRHRSKPRLRFIGSRLMADDSANIYPYPLQFDPSQWSNKYSQYYGMPLPFMGQMAKADRRARESDSELHRCADGARCVERR